jgi:hypothetical protein
MEDAVTVATDQPWPYPSYADRRWLGGERGTDKALATAVRALRSLVAETGGRAEGDVESLLAAMGRVADIAERCEWALLSLVGESRCQGVTWQAIGEALGVTKQAAQQRFAPYVKEALEQAEQG